MAKPKGFVSFKSALSFETSVGRRMIGQREEFTYGMMAGYRPKQHREVALGFLEETYDG